MRQLEKGTTYRHHYNARKYGFPDCDLVFTIDDNLESEHAILAKAYYEGGGINTSIPEIDSKETPFGTLLGNPIDIQDGYHLALMLIDKTPYKEGKHRLHFIKVTNEFLHLIEGNTTNSGAITYTLKENKSACYTIPTSEATFQLDSSIHNLYAGSLLVVPSILQQGNTQNGWHLRIEQVTQLSFLSPYAFLGSLGANYSSLYVLEWVSMKLSTAVFTGISQMMKLTPHLIPTLITPLEEFYKHRAWLWEYLVPNSSISNDPKNKLGVELASNMQVILPDKTVVSISNVLSTAWLQDESTHKTTTQFSTLLKKVQANKQSTSEIYNPMFSPTTRANINTTQVTKLTEGQYYRCKIQVTISNNHETKSEPDIWDSLPTKPKKYCLWDSLPVPTEDAQESVVQTQALTQTQTLIFNFPSTDNTTIIRGHVIKESELTDQHLSLPELTVTEQPFGYTIGPVKRTQNGYHLALMLPKIDAESDTQLLYYDKVTDEYLCYKGLLPEHSTGLVDINEVINKHKEVFKSKENPEFAGFIPKHTSSCYTTTKRVTNFVLRPDTQRLYAGSIIPVPPKKLKRKDWRVCIEQKTSLGYISPLAILDTDWDNLCYLDWVCRSLDKKTFLSLSRLFANLRDEKAPKVRIWTYLIVPVSEFYKNANWLLKYYLPTAKPHIENKEALHLAESLQLLLEDGTIVSISEALSSEYVQEQYNKDRFKSLTYEGLLANINTVNKEKDSIPTVHDELITLTPR